MHIHNARRYWIRNCAWRFPIASFRTMNVTQSCSNREDLGLLFCTNGVMICKVFMIYVFMECSRAAISIYFIFLAPLDEVNLQYTLSNTVYA